MLFRSRRFNANFSNEVVYSSLQNPPNWVQHHYKFLRDVVRPPARKVREATERRLRSLVFALTARISTWASAAWRHGPDRPLLLPRPETHA